MDIRMLLYSHNYGGRWMAQKAPGKAHRKGLTLLQVADMFCDETAAIRWLEEVRWPHGPFCPKCGSFNVQSGIKHKSMTHRCRDCPNRQMFTLRMGAVMEGTKMPYRVWAIGIYLFMTNIKGISSMRLHRELGIGQKAAWFMLQRLRKATESGAGSFSGPVEVDETYMGGKRKNMSNAKRRELKDTGRGGMGSGKAAIVGMKDRASNEVRAKAVQRTDAQTLQGFIAKRADAFATVYTDDAKAYQSLPFEHGTVKHSVSEYVKGEAHTNGMESFWALLKRGYQGVYHKMSPKHLDRYVNEFARRHNIRDMDTIQQMRAMVDDMALKRLKYRELIADNGLSSGARS